MNQKFKRILSLFLSLLMGMSALPAYAAPEQAADQSSTTSQTAETNTETNKTAAKQKISASGSITVGDEQVPFSMDESDINAAMVADNSEDTTVDTSDPAVKSVKKELKSTKADGTEEKADRRTAAAGSVYVPAISGQLEGKRRCTGCTASVLHAVQ